MYEQIELNKKTLNPKLIEKRKTRYICHILWEKKKRI